MIYVWLIVIAVGVTAFFSAAEMAFIGANRVRLRHLAEAGNRTAARYLESFKQPERLLSTAMMGVTLAHIIASSVATWALIPVLGNMAAVAVTLVPHPAPARLRRSHPEGGGAGVGHRAHPEPVPGLRAGEQGPLTAHLGDQRDRERCPRASWAGRGRAPDSSSPAKSSSSCSRWSRRRPT